MKHLSWFIGLIAITAAGFFLVAPSYACSPSEDVFSITLEDRVRNAPMIVHGTIIGGETGEDYSSYDVITKATVQVEFYLKGQGAETITIEGFGVGSDCRSVAQVEMEGIFFVQPIGDSITEYTAVYLGVHDAATRASEETIQAVIEITGERNQPIPPPLSTRMMAIVTNWLPIGLLLAGIGLGVWWFVMQRRDERKSKSKRH